MRAVGAEGKSLGAELLGSEPCGSKGNGNMRDLVGFGEGDGFSIALGRAWSAAPTFYLITVAVEKV